MWLYLCNQSVLFKNNYATIKFVFVIGLRQTVALLKSRYYSNLLHPNLPPQQPHPSNVLRLNEPYAQCDQIGRFIGLWATFQSLWQQLICPNLLHSYAIFVKVSKSLIFLVKSFLGNFYRHLALFYWSHCDHKMKFCKIIGKVCSNSD